MTINTLDPARGGRLPTLLALLCVLFSIPSAATASAQSIAPEPAASAESLLTAPSSGTESVCAALLGDQNCVEAVTVLVGELGEAVCNSSLSTSAPTSTTGTGVPTVCGRTAAEIVDDTVATINRLYDQACSNLPATSASTSTVISVCGKEAADVVAEVQRIACGTTDENQCAENIRDRITQLCTSNRSNCDPEAIQYAVEQAIAQACSGDPQGLVCAAPWIVVGAPFIVVGIVLGVVGDGGLPLCIPNPLNDRPYDEDDLGNILCAINTSLDAHYSSSPPGSGITADASKEVSREAAATLADPQHPPLGSALVVSGVADVTADTEASRAGMATLYLWPAEMEEQEGVLTRIGSAPIGDDGQFSLTSEFTPTLQAEANIDHGYLRMMLQVNVAGFTRSWFIERKALSNGDQLLFGDGEGAPIEPIHLTVGPNVPGSFAATTSANPAEDLLGDNYCHYRKLSRLYGVPVNIGEIHTGSNMTASVTYGNDDSNTISTRLSIGVRSWEATSYTHGGTKTVTNGAVRNVDFGTSFHQLLEAPFTFKRVKVWGACAREVYAEPFEWEGDLGPGTYQDHPTDQQCRKLRGAYQTAWRSTSKPDFIKNKGDGYHNENGIAILGAGLTSQQSYGKHLTTEWEFIGNPPWALCGDNGPPSKSDRVFTGS